MEMVKLEGSLSPFFLQTGRELVVILYLIRLIRFRNLILKYIQSNNSWIQSFPPKRSRTYISKDVHSRTMVSTFQIPSNDYWFLGEKNNKFIFLARKQKFLGNCIGNLGFLEGIFAQIPRSPEGILKIPRATRRARGPQRRPERGAKRLSSAVA